MKQNTHILRVARGSARHPVWAVVAWLLLIVGCVYLSMVVGVKSATPVDLGVGPSGRAAQIAQEAGLTEPATEYVLIGNRAGHSANKQERSKAAQGLRATLKRSKGVAEVGPSIQSKDGRWTMLPVTMSGDPETAADRVGAVRSLTARGAAEHRDLVIEQTGTASISAGIDDQLGNDFAKAETLTVPITLAVLLIVFGAFVAAVIPIVLALTCIAGAVGLSAVVSHVVPDSGTTSNMILLIGMAVGVDYSLFYLKREREERRAGADRRTAIENAAATSGHAVLFSGAAVIVSLAGLYLADDPSFNSLASAAILVVAVAVVGSVTVLPALLMLLTRVLDRPRVPFVWRLTNRKEERAPRFWPAMLRPSLARPATTMFLTILALAALAVPALDLSLATQKASDLPAKIPAVAAYNHMNNAFPQIGSSFTVAVRSDASASPQVKKSLATLSQSAAGAGLVADSSAPLQIATSPDRRTSTINLTSQKAANSGAAQAELRKLRQTLVPGAFAAIPSAKAFVGGETAASFDYDKQQKDKLPMVIGFVLLFNLLVMAFMFRSIVIGAVTLVMNLLSTGAAFGVIVLVFQHPWANSLIGYTSTGTVISWVPLFLFVILVGLSMDYHVFVLHRVHEEARSGASHRDAVRNGIVHSAGVVTGAAVVMAAVFSVFATLSFPEFKQLAVGLGVAVILDVVIVRGFLLPATLLVTGRWTWWPGPLSRRQHPTSTDAHAEPGAAERGRADSLA
jgi:RND superfamily putative drug exporter